MYFGGDTLLIPELDEIPRRFPDIDVAVVPINGLRVFGTQVAMNLIEAAQLCAKVQPSVAVPTHDAFSGGITDLFMLSYFAERDKLPEIFRDAVQQYAPMTRALDPGQSVSLRAAERKSAVRRGRANAAPAKRDEIRTLPSSRPIRSSSAIFMRSLTMPKIDGVMLGPGDGERIVGGGINATTKVPMSHPASTCSFEVRVPPGYDVGAHVHTEGEEVFYVISGTLDVLAFEPLDRDVPDWHSWRSADGKTYLRGGPGSFLYVPPNVPHAFSNPTDEETVMFFQSSAPGGHDNYFKELAKLLVDSHGKPAEDEMVALRKKYDIIQLTQLHPGHEADGS